MSNKCLLRFQYGSKSANDDVWILGGLGLLIGLFLFKKGQQMEGIILGVGLLTFGYLRSMKKKVEPEVVRIFEKGMYFPASCVETKSYHHDRDVYDNYNLVGMLTDKIDDDLDISLSPEKRTDFSWNELRKVQYNETSTIFIVKGGDIVIIQHSQIPKQHEKHFVTLVNEHIEKTGGILS